MTKFYFAFFLMMTLACRQSPNGSLPDVAHISDHLEIVHTDLMLFGSDSAEFVGHWQYLSREHRAFFELYLGQILQIKDSLECADPALIKRFLQLRQDSAFMAVNALVRQNLSDRTGIASELKKAAQFVRYYFPQTRLNRIYFLISGFSVGNLIFSENDSTDALGVGLEFFLGQALDYKAIDPLNPAFSNYLTRSFNRDHLIKKTWEVWADDRIPTSPDDRFLDQMLREGKKIWLLSKILPQIHDTVLFEYSAPQMNWCASNQVEIWSFFLDKQLIYSSEQLKFTKYIRPSPNSPGMPPDAPGRTGAYIGYHIIDAYARKSKTLSLEEVLNEVDSRKILEISRFKPNNI